MAQAGADWWCLCSHCVRMDKEQESVYSQLVILVVVSSVAPTLGLLSYLQLNAFSAASSRRSRLFIVIWKGKYQRNCRECKPSVV